jgi:hypothetical protein
MDDISLYRRPRTNAPSPPSQTGITHDSRTDSIVTLGYQVISKYPVNEILFSLTFDMYE